MKFVNISFLEQSIKSVKAFFDYIVHKPQQEAKQPLQKLDVVTIGRERKEEIKSIVSLDEAKIKSMFESLESCDLSFLKLEEKGMLNFANALRYATKLSSLTLSGFFHSKYQVKSVLDAINSNKYILQNLEYLNLSNNSLEDSIVYEIGECCKKLKKLKLLDLGYNSLKSGGVLYVIDSILKSKYITEKIELRFQSNDLTESGAVFFVQALKSLLSLSDKKIHIVLTSNSINKDYFNAINYNNLSITMDRSTEADSVSKLEDITSLFRFYYMQKFDNILDELSTNFIELLSKQASTLSDDDYTRCVSKFLSLLFGRSTDSFQMILEQAVEIKPNTKHAIMNYHDDEYMPLLTRAIVQENVELIRYLTQHADGAESVLFQADQTIDDSSPILTAWQFENYQLFDELLKKALVKDGQNHGLLSKLIQHFDQFGILDQIFEHMQQNDEYSEEFTEEYWNYCN